MSSKLNMIVTKEQFEQHMPNLPGDAVDKDILQTAINLFDAKEKITEDKWTAAIIGITKDWSDRDGANNFFKYAQDAFEQIFKVNTFLNHSKMLSDIIYQLDVNEREILLQAFKAELILDVYVLAMQDFYNRYRDQNQDETIMRKFYGLQIEAMEKSDICQTKISKLPGTGKENGVYFMDCLPEMEIKDLPGSLAFKFKNKIWQNMQAKDFVLENDADKFMDELNKEAEKYLPYIYFLTPLAVPINHALTLDR